MSMYQGFGRENNNQQASFNAGSFPMAGGSMGGGFSHKASILPTDMRCYFGCNQGFKKDYDLRLHIKLKHRDQSEEELQRAYQDAEEEIALVTRTQSKFQCALCPKVLTDNGAFFCHVQKSHNMQWRDYTDQYGRCEIESASFECKICSRVVKYGRNTIHGHLKTVHGINWTKYIARIRQMKEGRRAEELPNIEIFECKVCNSSVKYIFRVKHLKGTHKITEQEYLELFKEDAMNSEVNNHMKNEGFQNEDYKPSNIQQSIPEMQNTYVNPQFDISSNDMPVKNEFPMPVRPSKPPKSDIQDKTNRNCSACTIIFESRRLFIEHCTTFHNMKFRTQSGATISAPPKGQNAFREMNRFPGAEASEETWSQGTDPAMNQQEQMFGTSRINYS